MVKKQNNNAWIVYVIALIAIVALILGAIALNKANMTGKVFWKNWFQEEVETEASVPEINFDEYNGLLEGGHHNLEKYSHLLQGYEAKYDQNRRLVYEIIDDGLELGNDYEVIENGENLVLQSKINGWIFPVEDKKKKKYVINKRCVCSEFSGPGGCRFIIGCNNYGECTQCERAPK